MEYSQLATEVPHLPAQQHGSQESVAEVLMAIDSGHNNVIGCSMFNISDETLHVAEDIPRAPRQLIDYVERCISLDEQRIQVVASVDFSALSTREKLRTWGFDIASESGLTDIDLWVQRDQIGCVSAILSELRRKSYLMNTTSACERNHRIRSIKATGVRHEMINTLKKVRNAKLCVDLLRKGVDRCSMVENFCGSVWSNIRGFVIHALKLRDQIDAFMNKPTGFLHNAASRIHRQSLTSIGEILQRTVDFDQAEYNTRPTIMVGIDPQLDKMRRDYDALGLFLEKIALSITQRVPEWAARRIKSCIFLPHVGFLIAVELNTDIGMNSFLPIKDNGDIWDEFFVADGAVYYKNNQMRHLDARFGDIYRNIAGMDSPLF
ncbi:hypothetical protein E4U43_004043 [Claviceps pusilla]|uniref:Uncharacterized protein n=1 Tax=Claviceps pusilla TaxID=123648 RepID=A0A9P7T0E4_9HYPO|nr:hypothetical protein E4U43_004043 [Claviceps pusilla]